MRQTIFIFIALLTSYFSLAQQQITLEEIWSGQFSNKRLNAINSLNNSNEYAVLEYDRGTNSANITLYDFVNQQPTRTAFSGKDVPEIKGLHSYTFDKAEKQLLLARNSKPIFRRSSTALFYVYNIATKKLTPVANYPIQEPTFSNDGKKVAYVYQNNIYIFDVASQQRTQVTTDGKVNEVINGVTDWVYEEEFGFVRAFDWSADDTYLAYIRFDETDVPRFSMDMFNQQLYPSQHVFKYPKAGEKNADVSLHIYQVNDKKTTNINLSQYHDFYIARMQWTNDNNILSAQVLNRHQNNLDLLFVDAKTGTTKVVLNETDKAYVDVTDDLTFLADNSFIWTSEKNGYNHIYHYDKNGKLKKQLTNGKWDVTKYYGYNPKSQTIYYQSVENGSTNRDVYSVGLNGKNKKRLSKKAGTNNATFSPDFENFILSYSSAQNAPEWVMVETKTTNPIKTLVENSALENKLAAYNLPKKEFFEVETESGNKLNAWMIKPADFDPNKEYPVFMYQYSGPGSQQVANTWNSTNDYWFMMLAQNGYIVACVDGRGTGFKGADFKKSTYLELGKLEVQDQIEAAKALGKLPYVDANRFGIFGWSYGGFMSSNVLFQGNDVFKMAIAVAPVTSWRYYDSIYTERYMRTPQENASGYDNNSPINHVDKLKGKFLLVHGTADDNVHAQNAYEMVEALVQANKQFDWAMYPDKNHGIYGGNTRLHLYQKMTDYIKDNL
ncbi:S9 family peptidase [Flavobacterium agricola]|uniref:S9 family peptidase n=1 Tax=Flavobacterium agricola TaxID=2870839 RepID=A0ABY6LZ87_9FLAO|nr:S9 family peptidase [Flavobacterium agricola]UYW01322.1 S9 family peptidase [Flavobacterium agricola]